MAKYMIAFGVCVLVASMNICDARQSWLVRELRNNHFHEAQQLASQLIKIENDLGAKLPSDSSVEQYFRRVEKESTKCSNWSSCFKKDDPEKKAALLQLASLKSLASGCDLGSAVGLEVFSAALDRCETTSHVRPKRIEWIVQDHQKEHIKTCGPVYKRKYLDTVQSIDHDEQTKQRLARVQTTFDAISPLDFTQTIGFNQRIMAWLSLEEQQVRLIMLPDFRMIRHASQALSKIAREIGRQLFDAHKWNLISGPSSTDAELEKLLDEYLFEPCETFRSKLGDGLEPATIVATFVHMEPASFITKDQDFFKAMFAYGLCGKLLQERVPLQPELSKTLRALSPEHFGQKE